MSRRTFLQNMRQEVRKWDSSDNDSPRGSDVDSSGPLRSPKAEASASAAGGSTSQNTKSNAAVPESTLLSTHMTEFTVVSATTAANSPTSSPPPQNPLTMVDVGDAGPADIDVQTRPNRMAGLKLSAETLSASASAPQNESPFGAECPPSWTPQRATAVPDVLTTPRAFSRRRSSNSHGGLGGAAKRRSSSVGTPTVIRRNSRPGGATPAARASAAAPHSHSRDRSGSVNRMEASLIALQVELATEKRNNIEAEHHIMTLNTEVENLRRSNAQLSRELAEAATSAAAAAQQHNGPQHKAAGAAAASASNAPPAPLQDGDAAMRIEALEARLSELSRNLETKQRELSTKDERIRLLEHKLADQLLLQTGVHYMAIPAPTGPAAAAAVGTAVSRNPSSSSFQGHRSPPVHYQHNGNASLSGQSLSSATAAGLPSRRLWQADAPDVALAGPRIGAVRHVNVAGVAHPSEDATANARGSSAVRRRSPITHSSGPSEDLRRLSPVPHQKEEANGSRTRTPPPTALAPKATAESSAAAGPKATPRRPSVRRAQPLRPESTRRHSTRRRESGVSGDDNAIVPAVTTTSSSAVDGRRASKAADAGTHHVKHFDTGVPSVRSAAPPSARSAPRRPSVARRSSVATARGEAPEGSQRRGSRRDSGAAPPAWQHSSAAVGAGSTVAHSTTGSVYSMGQRALSTYRCARQPSTTRSVAQQSVRSSTSMRPRPQISFTSDGDTSTMKGTTTTVMFRARDTRKESGLVSEADTSAAAPAAVADSAFAAEATATV